MMKRIYKSLSKALVSSFAAIVKNTKRQFISDLGVVAVLAVAVALMLSYGQFYNLMESQKTLSTWVVSSPSQQLLKSVSVIDY